MAPPSPPWSRWKSSRSGGAPRSAVHVVPLALSRAEGQEQKFLVFSRVLTPGGFASLVIPDSVFEMSDLMKGLLLGTFFLTIFLIVYLLFNLRTDPLEVLRQRVKRFQIQLITELVESPGGADWAQVETARWSRAGTRSPGRSGAGSAGSPGSRSRCIDEYMARSWNEIIELIARRAETGSAQQPMVSAGAAPAVAAGAAGPHRHGAAREDAPAGPAEREDHGTCRAAVIGARPDCRGDQRRGRAARRGR